jgi:glycosyltransferase involved in cell wall biosynthesis
VHIGIDGGCWSNRRGYGRFLRELLQALAAEDGGNRYSVFLDSGSQGDFDLGGPFRAVPVRTAEGVAAGAHASGRRSVTDLLRMSRAVARERLDLFFFPSVYSYFPLLRRVPMLLGVHDTIADRNPRFSFASQRQERFWRWKVRLALAQARAVLTVSNYSRRSIAEHFGFPSSKIRVLYEGASPVFRRMAPPPERGRYILYAGGISPNKNLDTLIRAYARMEARGDGLKLVLVGDYKSDGFKSCHAELCRLVRELGLTGEVEFTGFVPDEDLCRLYNGASAFAMPSLDEGFGLPALEAMACGAPVVVAGGHALEEIAGGAGLVVGPRDEAGLAGAMDRVVRSPEVARALSDRSLRRAAEFSWGKAARQLVGIFSEVAEAKA